MEDYIIRTSAVLTRYTCEACGHNIEYSTDVDATAAAMSTHMTENEGHEFSVRIIPNPNQPRDTE